MLRVADCMDKKPKTIYPQTTLREAVGIMLKDGLSGLTVVDAKKKIIGVLTLGYLLRGFTPDHLDQLSDGMLSELEAVNIQAFFGATSALFLTADFYKQDIHPLTPELPLLNAAAEMERQMLEFLPVGKNGKLAGVLSRHHLMQAFFSKASPST